MPVEPIRRTRHDREVSQTAEAVYGSQVAHYQARAAQRLAGNDVWLWPRIEKIGGRPRARALDVGCGIGTNSFYLAKRGYSVTGVDISHQMISAARTAAATHIGLDNQPRFICADFCDWCPDEPEFDLVIATAFVHLFPAPLDRAVADGVLSHVAPHGTAIMSTTVETAHSQGLRHKNDSEHHAPGRPLSDERWRNHYTRETFRNLIEHAVMNHPGTWVLDEHVTADPGRPQQFWSDIVVTRTA
jgi:2-polyprenyl-3-methyl-5-hydroxy-6-metoxy-1,4-benzoquinol methylase